ncbi:MAG: preprotein translocase subunit SecG [Bdellovibrionota bacterium]
MTFVAVLHIIAALLLITLVLIQDSKGAMGGSFGGGGGSSNSILGPTGAPNFLFKMTRYIVLGFAITSLLLTKLSSEKSGSALDDLPPATTQSAPMTAPAETQKTATPETK